jgi:predicted RNA-binding Zn ribbon-like protein
MQVRIARQTAQLDAVVTAVEPMPIQLMNTIWADRGVVQDALTTPGELRAWLRVRYPHDMAGGADLERFRVLRDALRRLAAVVTADDRPAAASATTDAQRAVADVNAAAALAPAWPTLVLRDGTLDQTVAASGTPGDRLLTAIAREAIELFTGAGRVELRACRAPGCVLYFVHDHPRREWCSSACGNRARVARHYSRHRALKRQPRQA